MADGYVPVDDDEDDNIADHDEERDSVDDRLPLFAGTSVIFDQTYNDVTVNQGATSADSLNAHHPKQVWLSKSSVACSPASPFSQRDEDLVALSKINAVLGIAWLGFIMVRFFP